MSLSLSAVSSPSLHLRRPPRLPCNSIASIHLRRVNCAGNVPLRLNLSRNFFGFPGCSKRIDPLRIGRFVNCLNAENGEIGGEEMDEAERIAKGHSTMPERFRYLTKEAPDRPVKWPFFVAPVFLIYAWRAVIFELSNWTKAPMAIIYFLSYLSKFALALIFHFIGNPVTSSIAFFETLTYSIRAFYSSIVAYAPVSELTVVIIMASFVLAIAEAVDPNAVKSQPYTLSLSGFIGYFAVRGYMSERFFWSVLVGVYVFSRVVKKRDDVLSALPVAAVVAAVGEPWVRVVAVSSYVALVIWRFSKVGVKVEEVGGERKIPVPILGAALAVGVHLGARWAGYRHLTWMIA